MKKCMITLQCKWASVSLKDVGTFLAASNLKDLATHMASVVETPIILASEIISHEQLNSNDFLVEMLSDESREDVIRYVKSISVTVP